MTAALQKKIVLGENGEPVEVIMPWRQYQDILEALGLDLDSDAAADIADARADWKAGKKEAFSSLADFK